MRPTLCHQDRPPLPLTCYPFRSKAVPSLRRPLEASRISDLEHELLEARGELAWLRHVLAILDPDGQIERDLAASIVTDWSGTYQIVADRSGVYQIPLPSQATA